MRLLAFKAKLRAIRVAAYRAAEYLWSKTVKYARWPVPYYSRAGLYPQSVFVVIALVWFRCQPSWAVQGPGIAMGFLAVAAVYMAVRGEHSTRIEGGVWIVLSFLLFATEMRAIRSERVAHDTEQAQLQTREDQARRGQADSFAALIRNGQTLFNSLAEEKSLTASNLKHITGGDEYCWVVPEAPLPIAMGEDPDHQWKDNWWQIGLKNSGKVILPTCDVRFMPFPNEEDFKKGVAPYPPFAYRFSQVPVMGRRYFRYTSYFVKGDQLYSGVIETPTRSLIEVIKFKADANSLSGFTPICTVSAPGGKILEYDCNPQK